MYIYCNGYKYRNLIKCIKNKSCTILLLLLYRDQYNFNFYKKLRTFYMDKIIVPFYINNCS